MNSKSTLVVFLMLLVVAGQALAGSGERTAILTATPEVFMEGKILKATPNRPQVEAPAPWGSLGTYIADTWYQEVFHLREAANRDKFPADDVQGFESVIDYIGPVQNVNSRFTFEYPESVAVWFRPATQCSLISLLIRFDNYTPPDGSGLLGQTVDIGVYSALDEFNGTYDFTGYDQYFQGDASQRMLGDQMTSMSYNVSSLPVYGETGVTDPPIELDLAEFTVDGYIDIGKNDFIVSFPMPEGNDDASDLWAAGPPAEGNIHGWKYYANGRGSAQPDPGWIARYNFAIAAKVLYYGDPPPTIEDIEDLPDVYASVDPGPYTPTARIFDIGTDEFQGGLDAVWFIYSASNGAADTIDVTGQGVNDVYTGEIPSLPVGTTVEYWWFADDNGEENPDQSVAETHSTVSESRFFTIREKDPNATILVINDQAAQPVSSYYLDLLAAFGYGADYWDIDAYGLMSQGVLDLYSSLIWYQGSGTGGVLALGLDTLMVPNYLDNGGNLFLSSSDYIGIVHDSDFSGEWTAASYPFVTDYLSIGFYNSDADADETGTSLDTLYRGVEGDDLGDGIGEFLVVPEDLGYTNWNDMVETSDGFGFLDVYSPLVEEDWSAETGGVYYDGEFKTVFVPFPFEAIRDEMVRKELMMRILGFFGENARPVFTDVMGSRYGVSGEGPFPVTAYVDDMDGTVESVELGYSVNGGDYSWMAMSGSDGMYTGDIPALGAQDTIVTYTVRATDDVGGMNYSETREFYATDFAPTVNNLLYVGDNPFDWYTEDNIDPIMTGYLDNLGYEYDVWDADMLYTMDAHTVLNNYHTVIWAGYADWDPGVLPMKTEDNPFTEYLDQGGNLLLTSEEIQGAWTNWGEVPIGPGDFLVDEMGVNAIYHDFGYFRLYAFDSSAVTTGLDSVDMDTLLNLVNYSDYIEKAGPTPFLGFDGSSNYYTSVQSENTVFFAFNVARLEAEGGEMLLGNVLNYFGTPIETAIGDESLVNASVPVEFALRQNYPNPFNPTTNIEFALTMATDVKIAIYNVLGEKVRTLTDQNFKAGTHRITWNGTNESGNVVSSGVYIYKIETPEYTASRKMILMK